VARPGFDPERLLPPAACAELDRYPLTETEAAPHRDGPLGAVAGWYWCGAGGGLLALALHEETGLPLVAMLSALEAPRDDLPLELVLEAGVGCDAHVLCGCGWRAAAGTHERLVGICAERLRAMCADEPGIDPDDPPTAAAARAAARFLVARAGRTPR
jgi:hypothetical protein